MAGNRHAEINLELTRLLTECGTPAELFPAVLELFGSSFQWDFAAFWRVDYERLLIRCVATWKPPGKAYPQFESLSRARPFDYGVGIPGEVWRSQQPIWTEDLPSSENFPRGAVSPDFTSGAGIPIAIGRRVLGVIEFFSTTRRGREPQMLEFLTTAGAQIGLFLEKIRADEQLTGTDTAFHMLAKLSVDAIATIDESSTIVFVNEQLCELFGYTKEELIGAELTIIIPERLRAAHRAGLARYLSTGNKNISWDGVILPAMHHDGRELTVEVCFGEVSQQGRRLFSGFIRPMPKQRST